jgi:hypothetical protein
MAFCAGCKTETELYESQVPICIRCSEEQATQREEFTLQDVRRALFQDMLKTTARANAAAESFNRVLGRSPAGLPHPDGSQRIKNTSGELSKARKEMMRAHTRLNEFLNTGIVPDDLKHSD